MTITTQHELEFFSEGSSTIRTIEIFDLVIAGWTGRNVEAMEAHIAELEALGIKRPSKTPTYYRVTVDQLTTDKKFQVIGEDSSGEVEYVLLKDQDTLWVGLGSDHTDRKVEAFDVTLSKQICRKPIARTFWRYDELIDHWDTLLLSSKIERDGSVEKYQEGSVSAMRTPQDLLKIYGSSPEEWRNGTLMFCGTLAVEGGVRPANSFTAELTDPQMGRSIILAYEIETIPAEE